jgi:hypothetical protein
MDYERDQQKTRRVSEKGADTILNKALDNGITEDGRLTDRPTDRPTDTDIGTIFGL